MSGVRLLHRVRGQKADGIDARVESSSPPTIGPSSSAVRRSRSANPVFPCSERLQEPGGLGKGAGRHGIGRERSAPTAMEWSGTRPVVLSAQPRSLRPSSSRPRSSSDPSAARRTSRWQEGGPLRSVPLLPRWVRWQASELDEIDG